MKQTFTIFILLFLSCYAKAQNWYALGPHDSAQIGYGPTNYCSIAINSMGVPYIAFQDADQNGKVTVRKYNGALWETVGNSAFSVGTANYISIAIDMAGVPYVAYQDVSNSNKATVKKYDGTSWGTVGTAGFSAGQAGDISLAIDGNGIPHVAYQDGGNSNKATVMKYNGTSWVTVGTAGFSAGNAQYTSFTIDGNGVLYVAYKDAGNGNKATVKKYDGISWTTVGTVGFTSGIVGYTSIAIGSFGVPYVAYQDASAGNKITVKKYDGTSWTTVGIAGISSGYSTSNSIIIDATGTPYIAYADGNLSAPSSVKKFDGSAWITVGNSPSSGSLNSIMMAKGPNSTLYTAFIDYANGNKPCVKKLSGNSWVGLYTMGIGGDEGDYPSAVLDHSGIPYIAYADSTQKLTVKKYDGTSWVLVGTPGFSNIGPVKSIAMAVNKNNVPYVAYQEQGSPATYRAAVRKFDGTAWVSVGPPAISIGMGDFLSIAIDSSGTPYVSYVEEGLNFDYKVVVKKYNGSSWVDIGSGISATYTAYTKIAFDNNGILYIAYTEPDPNTFNYVAKVKRYDGTSWVDVGTTSISTGDTKNTTLVLDGNNIPYIAYQEQDVNYSYHTMVKKYEANNWIDISGNGFPGSSSYNMPISIAIGNNNIPYVAYLDSVLQYKVNVKEFDSGRWSQVGNAPVSVGGAYFPFLIANERKLIIAYRSTDYNFTSSGGAFAKQYDLYCDTVIGLSVNNISAGTALIKWKSIANASGYEYVIDQVATAPSSGTLITDTSYEVNGLLANTAYYAHVRTACNNNRKSLWSTIAFTTKQCDTPLNLVASNITSQGADISWTVVPGVLNYEYVIDQSSNIPTSSGNILTTNTYTATGLVPNTTYYFHLLTHCDSINISSWITTTFTTSPLIVGIDKKRNTSIQVYPNPAKDVINIHIAGVGDNGSLKLINIDGKIIKGMSVNETDIQVPLNDVVPGHYLLKYTDDKQTQIITIEKF